MAFKFSAPKMLHVRVYSRPMFGVLSPPVIWTVNVGAVAKIV